MITIANDGEFIDTDNDPLSKNIFMEEVIWNGYARVGKCSHMAREDSRQFLIIKGDRCYLTEVTICNKFTFCKRITQRIAVKWLLYNNHHELPEVLQHVLENELLINP